ncbi:MAG: hypothetical protein WC456_01080 [Patescibacteria group bacterium]
MTRVFFDARRPELIFSLAAILKKMGDKIDLIVPVTPESMMAEEEKISQTRFLFQYEAGDSPPEPANIYILGIGPDDDEESEYLRSFIDHHGANIALWIDDGHNWTPDLLFYAMINKVKIRLHPISCLYKLRSLRYNFPLEWEIAVKNFREFKNDPQKDFPYRRYYLAWEAGRIMAQNVDDQYYHNETYLSILWATLKELETGTAEDQLDYFQDLTLTITQATEEAKRSINANHPFFRAAKDSGRPIGFLRLNHAHADIQEIIKYGVKKFPWLFVLEYSEDKEIYSEVASVCLPGWLISYYLSDNVLRDNKSRLYKILNEEVTNYPVS